MKDLKLFGIYTLPEGKKTVMLKWDFTSDNDFPEQFIIEKSQDNKEFKIIGKINKILPSQRIYYYLFVDENLDYGKNYYRILLRKRRSGRF